MQEQRARFTCPTCEGSFPAPVTLAGQEAPCPKCRTQIARWPTPTRTPVELMLDDVVEFYKQRGQTVRPVGALTGPRFHRFKIEPVGRADFAKIRREAENLKLHLKLPRVPIISSQTGFISVDVERAELQDVALKPLLSSEPAHLRNCPAFPVGVDVSGSTEWLNFQDGENCHLLVAGTTGSGKSQFLKAMLASLAQRLPVARLQFRLVDPKRVTFGSVGRSPFVRGGVALEPADAMRHVSACVEEMGQRYRLLQQQRKEDIAELPTLIPRVILVIDELAELMSDRGLKKELEPLLVRLGQLGRAAGIHLVLGMQRPEASVITPLLRSNIPGRIGLTVASEKDSKLFLDQPDAAHLCGRGDLLWKRAGGLVRLQGALVKSDDFPALLLCQ